MAILLLEKGCQNCSYVKMALDFEKVEDDSYILSQDEKLFVYFSNSSEGTKLFTQQFGMTQFAPILKLENGDEFIRTEEIIRKIKLLGYGKR